MKTRVVFVHEVKRFQGLKTSYEFELESQAKAFVILCMKAHPEWSYKVKSTQNIVDDGGIQVKIVMIEERKSHESSEKVM